MTLHGIPRMHDLCTGPNYSARPVDFSASPARLVSLTLYQLDYRLTIIMFFLIQSSGLDN